MNQNLIDYLKKASLQAQVVLLTANDIANRKGVSNVMYHALQKKSIKPSEVMSVLKSAEQAGILSILCETANFCSIQFIKPKTVRAKKATTHKEVSATKIIKLAPAKKPELELMPVESNITVQAQPSNGTELILVPPPLPQNYKPSAALMRAVIGDYCQFYKAIIQHRALLAGVEIKNPMNPKIGGFETNKMAELCVYFSHNGFGEQGEQGIRTAFLRIYSQWHLLPLNYQNYFQPQQICRNINGIYAEMINFKNKRSNRKDEELAEKHQQSQPEDFSHLVAKRG